MNAVRGALGILLVELAIYLAPFDSEFFQFPNQTKGLVMIGLIFLLVAGGVLFIWGVLGREPWKDIKPSDQAATEEPKS